ncbi:MAG: relaxase/mobilization nuclease domain-containing protein [Bacteroidota bacterium]|nr:relaxase/mobilization nuclease domain-containing protein [Bacteroidota bacterium]
MISKQLSASSFYHTCRYICNKPEAEVLITEGVRGHNYKLMADDFETQQQLWPEKSKACFHAILSFYPGEKPSDAMMEEIAKKYLEELKIADTQYAIVKHADRAHLHLHIVANMVNNKGKAINDSWIGLRGKKIAQGLTEEYKLIPALEKNLKLTNMKALNEMEANKYKIYIAISENLPQSKNLEDLESRLLKLGIGTQYKYKSQTQEKQGVSFRIGKYNFKGSEVDRKFSFAGLEKILKLTHKEVLEQQQSKEQKLTLQQEFPHQKLSHGLKLKPGLIETKGKSLLQKKSLGLEKSMKLLLKPEGTDDQTPYQFTIKHELTKKKKQSHRPRL